MEYSYKFRIYPNREQEEIIQKTFGCCRFLYNHFLSERISSYQQTGKSPSRFEQSKEIPGLKKQYPWLAEVDSHALQRAVKNLDTAYQNFFRRVKQGGKPGFPKYKSKSDARKSYNTTGTTLKAADDAVKLPKLGWVKCAVSRPVQGRILNATVSQVPTGKYFVSLCCTGVELEPAPSTGKETGVDVGLRSFATLSDGTKYPNDEKLEKNLKKLARLQRQLSRKKRGSGKYEKARMQVARLHEKIATQRADALHKLSTSLVREYDLLAVESLAVGDMLQEGGKGVKMNRRVSGAGWGAFLSQLDYKAGWYGKQVVAVDRTFPSTQICSCCGALSPEVSKTLPKTWTCPSCGAVHDVDVNAAVNLLREGRRILAAGEPRSA